MKNKTKRPGGRWGYVYMRPHPPISELPGRVAMTGSFCEKPAVCYDLSVPTSPLSAGTYFMRLEAGAKAKTEKLILR